MVLPLVLPLPLLLLHGICFSAHLSMLLLLLVAVVLTVVETESRRKEGRSNSSSPFKSGESNYYYCCSPSLCVSIRLSCARNFTLRAWC